MTGSGASYLSSMWTQWAIMACSLAMLLTVGSDYNFRLEDLPYITMVAEVKGLILFGASSFFCGLLSLLSLELTPYFCFFSLGATSISLRIALVLDVHNPMYQAFLLVSVLFLLSFLFLFSLLLSPLPEFTVALNGVRVVRLFSPFAFSPFPSSLIFLLPLRILFVLLHCCIA